jgi:hypothetical protein
MRAGGFTKLTKRLSILKERFIKIPGYSLCQFFEKSNWPIIH